MDYAVTWPSQGQYRARNELRNSGISISGSGVRSIWQRHNLESFLKRLNALEERFARGDIALNEALIAALDE